MSAPLSDRVLDDPVRGMSQARALRVYFGRPYLRINTWIWSHLPASLRSKRPLRGYGSHVHSLIQLRERTQSTGTFFFRNRPELELLVRLLDQFPLGSTIDMAILGCSKGAEVYSFSYMIRTKRPDLNLRLCALDISREPLEIAEAGVYPLNAVEPSQDRGFRSIFERMSSVEMEDLFEQDLEKCTSQTTVSKRNHVAPWRCRRPKPDQRFGPSGYRRREPVLVSHASGGRRSLLAQPLAAREGRRASFCFRRRPCGAEQSRLGAGLAPGDGSYRGDPRR